LLSNIGLHSFFQDGRVESILHGLHNVILFPEIRDDKYGEINLYFRDW